MLDMRRFEKQWRAKAKDVNFSFSLIIADLLRLMQSHVTSSLLTLAIICTSVHRIFPRVQILRHDTKGGVNIMHHLGQRCMLTIVSALQIQNLSRLGLNSWSICRLVLNTNWNDFLDQKRQSTVDFWCRTHEIFSWERVLIFWTVISQVLHNSCRNCESKGAVQRVRISFHRDLVW